MADIIHRFPVRAPRRKVFEAVSQPGGLDEWWTLTSAGTPGNGEIYLLGFGPGHDWKARVTRVEPEQAFELELIEADTDWVNTRVGFELEEDVEHTLVEFHHKGWPEENNHYRTSCYCWAMYLRILKRFLEAGERVPYEKRLDA